MLCEKGRWNPARSTFQPAVCSDRWPVDLQPGTVSSHLLRRISSWHFNIALFVAEQVELAFIDKIVWYCPVDRWSGLFEMKAFVAIVFLLSSFVHQARAFSPLTSASYVALERRFRGCGDSHDLRSSSHSRVLPSCRESSHGESKQLHMSSSATTSADSKAKITLAKQVCLALYLALSFVILSAPFAYGCWLDLLLIIFNIYIVSDFYMQEII